MKLEDAEIIAVLERERKAAADYNAGQLGHERKLAYEYYYGKPFGNEEEGSSAMVSPLVAEVVDAALPEALKVFASSDAAVQCEPRNEEDVEAAQQATDLCNYVFWTQNNGFLLLYEGIKDAFLQKVGAWKYYWDESVAVGAPETYPGLTLDQITMLQKDPQVEIVAASPVMGAVEQMFEVTVRVKRKTGKVKIDCIPPEDLRVSRRATSIDPQAIPYIGVCRQKTLSDLVEMGYDRKVVEELRSDDDSTDFSETRAARTERLGTTDAGAEDDSSSTNPMMRRVWYNEEYVLLDADGDGIAERLSVCSVGDTILHKSEIERVPIACITPKIMPHEFYGISLADDCMDLQLLKSTLWRQMLDNLYLTNHPMQEVVVGNLVDIDDVLNPRPGGAVRVNAPGSVTPLTVPFVAGPSFQMIEFLEQETEGRTGINRYGNSPSLNPDSLNKTLGGANIAVEKSQARMQLICRTFAETGIKDLFSGILWLLSKHQDTALTIRIRNKWVNVDPRAWANQYDFVCNVGLGTGSRDQQMQHMSMFGQVLQAGAQYGLVTPKNAYNYIVEYAKLIGFKDHAKYATDPTAPEDPANPKPPPQPPPEVQVKQMELQAKQQELQAKMRAEGQKFQAETARDQQKAAMDAETKRQEMAFKLQVEGANDQRQSALDQQKAALEERKMMLEHELKLMELAQEKELREREMQMTHERESAALQVQAHMQDRDIGVKERTAQQAGEKQAAEREKTKPVKGYNIKRGPDGRADSLDVIR